MSITPKNWCDFQHYKDRAPAWIKLHRVLLDNFDFHRLPVASKALAPMLWLLASEYDNGKITASIEELAFRVRMDPNDFQEALNPLIESGFFISASKPLARCKPVASLEKEGETEKEGEKRERQKMPAVAGGSVWPARFSEIFWLAYPLKEGKKKALESLARLERGRKVEFQTVLDGLERYKRSKPPDRAWMHATTFLNGERWNDEQQGTHTNGKHPPKSEWAATLEHARDFASASNRGTAPVPENNDPHGNRGGN